MTNPDQTAADRLYHRWSCETCKHEVWLTDDKPPKNLDHSRVFGPPDYVGLEGARTHDGPWKLEVGQLSLNL